MGIKQTKTVDIDRMFNELLQEAERQIIETLHHAGEEAVKYARLPHAKDWNDDTGNLRASIGYGVFKDGEPIMVNGFESVANSTTGPTEGKQLCLEVGSKTADYAVVVVAGRNYAIYVESRGYDVLTGAERIATQSVAKELADMATNIKNAFK